MLKIMQMQSDIKTSPYGPSALNAIITRNKD